VTNLRVCSGLMQDICVPDCIDDDTASDRGDLVSKTQEKIANILTYKPTLVITHANLHSDGLILTDVLTFRPQQGQCFAYI